MTSDFCYILSLSFYVPLHYAALAVPNTVITWNDLFVYARSRKKARHTKFFVIQIFLLILDKAHSSAMDGFDGRQKPA